MSADLHLIAAPPDPNWLAKYEYVESFSMIGEPWWDEYPAQLAADPDFDPSYYSCISSEEHDRLRAELGFYETLDDIWIGQVSWLKAGLMAMGEPNPDYPPERWLPAPVVQVQQLVCDYPILTPALASAIMGAMNLPNNSAYGKREYMYGSAAKRGYGWKGKTGQVVFAKTRGLARRQDVRRWLDANMGCRLVGESW